MWHKLRDRRRIWNLYMKQKGVVRVENRNSDECIIGRGVRQGCCLSPVLFSLYADMMKAEALEGVEEGIKVRGRNIQDFRFVDDQAMIGKMQIGLQKIMNKLNKLHKNMTYERDQSHEDIKQTGKHSRNFC